MPTLAALVAVDGITPLQRLGIGDQQATGLLRKSGALRGTGVPEGELQAIFEPYFRSANRDRTAAFGLGLAIARCAIEAQGGTIRFTRQPMRVARAA
ncbi:MAG TPA: ATP-binding protein, partial [Lamprocystis sp. (in: g-proteobacteria)]|nr:ATP-binding protein [Lamprocystis sp. (in: g-proteobacteria)]